MQGIVMHGPDLSGSGEIQEAEVHPVNVVAFERSGWVKGPKPQAEKAAEPQEKKAPKKKADK